MHTLRTAFAVASILALAGCGTVLTGPNELGSGTPATEDRSVGAFDELHVATGIRAEVSIGSTTSVRVTADDNLVDNVVTDVSGSRLDVSMRGGINPRTPIIVEITAPALTGVRASSAAVVTVRGLEAETLSMAADSSGRLEADGAVTALEVAAGSAGRVELGGLPASRATVDVDSAGYARVAVTDEVDGQVSSAGVLALVGEPAVVDVDTNSGGVVRTE